MALRLAVLVCSLICDVARWSPNVIASSAICGRKFGHWQCTEHIVTETKYTPGRASECGACWRLSPYPFQLFYQRVVAMLGDGLN
jgi:hypothetical protein